MRRGRSPTSRSTSWRPIRARRRWPSFRRSCARATPGSRCSWSAPDTSSAATTTGRCCARPDGARGVGQPPLGGGEDVAAVWAALAEGTLDTVGTDHIPHPRAAKLAPGLSFDRIPPGVANLETLLPMLYSEGVRGGRLTITRMVEVLAAGPARVGGMYPRTGALALGSDGD